MARGSSLPCRHVELPAICRDNPNVGELDHATAPTKMEFKVDRHRDPDGSTLQLLLEAQIRCERMAAARSLIMHLLSITGVVIWLEEIWPGLFAPDIRFLAIEIFGGNLLLVLGVVLEEVVWRGRLKRGLRANQVVASAQTQGSDLPGSYHFG